MTIKSELMELAQDTDRLMPEDVVEWAGAHRDSALHRALEWDDRTAAHEYRVQQVRQLISIHVIMDDGFRGMVSLSVDRVDGGGYRKMTDVLPDRTLRDIMLEDALRDLDRLQKRYKQLTELAAVWAAKDNIKPPPRGRGRRRGGDEARPSA